MKSLQKIALLISLSLTCCVLNAGDYLYDGFVNPPSSYRPRVWWHWMNGNVTKDGIRKDLEWMHRSGIVGFHNFDAGMETPQLVENRLPYMSAGWKDAFNYMLDIADSLDMEVSIASSPGWSCTGGPWVSEDDAMKKLCWSSVDVSGGERIEMALPAPMCTSGFYQEIPAKAGNPSWHCYFRDVAVIGVRLPKNDLSMKDMGAVLTASDGSDCGMLVDGNLGGCLSIKPDRSGDAWVCCTFPQEREIKSVTVVVAPSERSRFGRILEYSLDGVHFSALLDQYPQTVTPVKTFDVAPVKARFFRFRSTEEGQTLDLSEFALSQVVKVNMGAEKAGFFASAVIDDSFVTPFTEDAVKSGDIIDLTPLCGNDRLDWEAPDGRWRVFRFGYSLTGKQNGPASPEATGLEVDKFDAEAVRRYYPAYLDMYQDASRGRLGDVLKYVMIDSYEAKCQTWTASMPQEFESRRGYSLRRWLPALTGMVVCSADSTERFLQDWRLTLGELLRDSHYEGVDSLLHEYGIGRHTESHGYKRTFVSDGMDLKRRADIPMSEFWVRSDFHSSDFISEADIRESASVCHLYGQKICAAESFTADGPKKYSPSRRAWCHHPGSLKPVADAAMASGVNRFIIHTSVHQPDDWRKPGIGLGKFGQWFTRKETWADEAGVWTDYLSRSSFLLSQGDFVADIAFFFGESTNVTGRFMSSRPDIPLGYAYDFVNRSALLEVLQPVGGLLVSKATGMSYRAFAVDCEVTSMSVDVLRKIREIADSGILVAADEPLGCFGFSGCSESEFEALVRSIWHSGRANVVPLNCLGKILQDNGIDRDLYVEGMETADIRFIHRTLPGQAGGRGGELYWVANLTPEYRTLDASFRITGLKPEIWHADTGVIEPASYKFEDGRTVVRLEMSPDDSQFIIFRKWTDCASSVIHQCRWRVVAEAERDWTVCFEPGLGAPESIILEGGGKLPRLDENELPGVRYYSGTATYSTKMCLKRKPSGTMVLDIGEVHDMARVYVNGQDLGLVWKEPFRIDVSGAVKKGDNDILIRVTNTWVNRVIGDTRPDGGEKVTWTPYQEYGPEDPLLPSGLVGPVILKQTSY